MFGKGSAELLCLSADPDFKNDGVELTFHGVWQQHWVSLWVQVKMQPLAIACVNHLIPRARANTKGIFIALHEATGISVPMFPPWGKKKKSKTEMHSLLTCCQ